MRLIHWSRKPVVAVESREQIPHDGEYHRRDKPKGLWVSDEDAEDSWSRWCGAEEYDGMGEHGYEVLLRQDAQVLFVHTEDGLLDFNERYGMTSPESWRGGSEIDWHGVANEYQGIVVTPYQWNQRLGDLFWYYSWDCASGCIWDPDAVMELVGVEIPA